MLCDDFGPPPSVEQRSSEIVAVMLDRIADWEGCFTCVRRDGYDNVVLTYFDTYKTDELELIVTQIVYRPRGWLRDFFDSGKTLDEWDGFDDKVRYVVESERTVTIPVSPEDKKRLEEASNHWFEVRARARADRNRKNNYEQVRAVLGDIQRML